MNSQCPVVVSLPGDSSASRPWLANALAAALGVGAPAASLDADLQSFIQAVAADLGVAGEGQIEANP